MTAAPLAFPRDFGAHPEARIEWWYATGWLQAAEASPDTPAYGFQLTFFRTRTGLAQQLPSRFAARQLLFAHAALTDLAGRRQLHAQRIARWSGDEAAPRAAASSADTRVHLGGWRLERGAVAAAAPTPQALPTTPPASPPTLTLSPTQPLLLQGQAGWSRKGPDAAQASHYYSQPQLTAAGELRVAGRTQAVRGQAWLDHEWSDSLLDAQAVGWDWIGINLHDGSALTAFVLRRADGSALWAGGSHRAPGAAARIFGPDEVRFTPGRRWTSAASRAALPGAVDGRDPIGPAWRGSPARRAGTRQPRQHRRVLLGRPVGAARCRRAAHRPGLPRDDRLRRAAEALGRRACQRRDPASAVT